MILGLDLSLQATGVSILTDGYTIINTMRLSVPYKGVERLFHLELQLLSILEENNFKLACIENPAYKAEGKLFDLGQWSGIVELSLYKKGLPFIHAVPSQVKKYATGKGVGNKNIIIKEVFKNFNEDFMDDNEADAYILSRIGLDYYNKYISKLEINLPKYQLDVLKAIEKSYGDSLLGHLL